MPAQQCRCSCCCQAAPGVALHVQLAKPVGWDPHSVLALVCLLLLMPGTVPVSSQKVRLAPSAHNGSGRCTLSRHFSALTTSPRALKASQEGGREHTGGSPCP